MNFNIKLAHFRSIVVSCMGYVCLERPESFPTELEPHTDEEQKQKRRESVDWSIGTVCSTTTYIITTKYQSTGSFGRRFLAAGCTRLLTGQAKEREKPLLCHNYYLAFYY